MATKVNIHQAKTQFSQLVARALAGEEIVIARAGVPLLRFTPIARKKKVRKPGSAKGKIFVADDFDLPLPPEVLETFER